MGKKEIFIEQCNKFLEEHKSEYDDKVLIRTACAKNESGEWVNALTTFRILKKDETIAKREDIVYDVFALLEEVVPLSRFKEIVNSIWNYLKIKNYQIISDAVDYKWNYLSSRNLFCEWPGLYLEIELNYQYKQQVSYLNYSPVKYKIKPFKTCYDAIADWLEIEDFRGRSDPRIGNTLIFLPNYKGMIKEIVCNKDVFELYVDGAQESLSKLDCQFELTFDDKIKRENFILEEEQSKVSFPVEIEPLKILVNIVTEKGERLDYYYEDEINHTGKIRFVRRAINKEIMKKINNGENDKIEFKPFVDLESKDDKHKDKKEEILQTIIAFANTNGGGILAGVLDDTEIEGMRQDLLKTQNPEDFIKKFSRDIRRFVSNSINKGISLDFQKHEIGEKIVLEIKIEEGKEKPYADIRSDSKRQNQYYIRKGSTNRKPTPEELRLLFKEIKNNQ